MLIQLHVSSRAAGGVDEWRATLTTRIQLRPVHRATFTDNFGWHGRLYTAEYGHQGLRKIERQTIEFNDSSAVELDYSGMHPRMLYHLDGIDYRDDPYAVVKAPKSGAMRLLAKKVINTAINAESRKQAISACNESLGTRTRGRHEEKTGKSLEKAITLRKAIKKVGLTFAQLYDRAKDFHAPIAEHFCSDAGIWLMRYDSAIALDVMYHFTKQSIPCLCCHDSFIVPEHHMQELHEELLSGVVF